MRILIAEDDPVSRRLLEATLGRWGYEVTAVTDGTAAWEALQQPDAPPLAILDWMMPGLDGVEVCRRLRGLPQGPTRTYVLFLTAKTHGEDIATALGAGGDDYIQKPFDRDDLLARLRVGERVLDLQRTLVDRVGQLEEAMHRLDERTAELDASEARLRAIVDGAHDAIVVVNTDGVVCDFNRAAERTFGRKSDGVVGRPAADLLMPERTRPGFDAALAAYRAANDSPLLGRRLSAVALRRDGAEFPVELSVTAVEAPGSRLLCAIVEDVTERERLEVELRHAQKLESVGLLAAGIAHEINTPIQFVGDNTRFLADAFASMQEVIRVYREDRGGLEEDPAQAPRLAVLAKAERDADLPYLDVEIPKAIQQSLEGIDRVASIVRAMKEFAHPQAAEMTGADLNQALLSTITVARNEIKYVADVETELADIPPVLCHLGDVNQVFLNLLVNAAHAIGDVVAGTGGKGRIHVRTSQEGADVVIAIQDTGGGIPEPIRAKIFDPFFTTKEVGRGTGQGLAIARSIIVDKHGGGLTFETVLGRGTTFFIRLPIERAPVARDRANVAA